MTSADLELVVGGRPLRFPAVWLRDNCPCAGCVASGTGQKLNDITDIPNGPAITRTEDAGESVAVTFAPDQHRSVFSRSWLEEHALDRHADDGGDTGLVDGFAAAAALRAEDAQSFDTLARTPVPFGYIDKATELRASLPLIHLSPRGRIRGVRFNNRSVRPLRLPYAEVTVSYDAYRRWAELLAQPGRQLNLRLAPGDCLVFDNTRVLHARTTFGLAEAAGADPPLVAAALLHDIGHLRNETDDRHGEAGARWLSQWFGAAADQARGVRDRALTATELRTLNAIAPPR